jgi:hypothetical protein
MRIGSARADRDQPAFGLEHVAVAGEDERALGVGQRQHGLEAAQQPVGAPVLGQFHRRAHEIALVLVELGLEALEQGKGVGRGAGEAGQDAIVIDAAHLTRALLDDDRAQRHLAVAAHGDRGSRAAPKRWWCREIVP